MDDRVEREVYDAVNRRNAEMYAEIERLRSELERIAYAKSTVLSDEQMEAVAQVFQRWAREALEHKAVSADGARTAE